MSVNLGSSGRWAITTVLRREAELTKLSLSGLVHVYGLHACVGDVSLIANTVYVLHRESIFWKFILTGSFSSIRVAYPIRKSRKWLSIPHKSASRPGPCSWGETPILSVLSLIAWPLSTKLEDSGIRSPNKYDQHQDEAARRTVSLDFDVSACQLDQGRWGIHSQKALGQLTGKPWNTMLQV